MLELASSGRTLRKPFSFVLGGFADIFASFLARKDLH
jgi:hypothetical protein